MPLARASKHQADIETGRRFTRKGNIEWPCGIGRKKGTGGTSKLEKGKREKMEEKKDRIGRRCDGIG